MAPNANVYCVIIKQQKVTMMAAKEGAEAIAQKKTPQNSAQQQQQQQQQKFNLDRNRRNGATHQTNKNNNHGGGGNQQYPYHRKNNINSISNNGINYSQNHSLKTRNKVSHSVLSNSLHEVITSRNLIESSDGIQKRRRVMKRLDDMLCQWSDSLSLRAQQQQQQPHIAAIAYANKKPPTKNRMPTTNNHYPILLSFGSYRLGVHTPDADVDCLVLAPPHIQRHDFFDSWISLLRRNNDIITNLHPVATAYTPVIKFTMNGIKIDMIFARLNDMHLNWLDSYRSMRLLQQQQRQRRVIETKVIGNTDNNVEVFPSSNIETSSSSVDKETKNDASNNVAAASMYNNAAADDNDDYCHYDDDELQEVAEMQVTDNILIGLDETSVRSVNGVRVSQYLLAIAGTNPTRLENFRLTLRIVKEWARVHGLYSNVLGFLGGVNWAILVCWVCKENPNAKASMLLKLFFRTFANWSWPRPVYLSKEQKHPIMGVSPYPIWDPVNNFRDSKHLMPIITPCYPSMNSSYNVGEPQLRRIQDELRRATKISSDVCFGRKTWSELFKGNDFFRQHANYLQVDIFSSNEDHFREWFGFCEARMRILIAGLENPIFGTQAYPFAKFFTRKEEDGKYVSSFFIAVRFAANIQKVDLGPLVIDYLQIVNSWERRNQTMDLAINIVRQENLPPFVFEVECSEKENEAVIDDGSSTASETASKSSGEGDCALTVDTTIVDKDADIHNETNTIENGPAKEKRDVSDPATPSLFISPLKRVKLG